MSGPDTLAALHAEAFAAPWSAQAIAALLAQPGVFALTAPDEGAPQGFILIRAVAGEAEILTLAVAPQARRQGLARRLVTAAGTQAATRGAGRLFLEVAADNDAALALYAHCRFARAGLRRGYYARPGGVAIDAVVMALELGQRDA